MCERKSAARPPTLGAAAADEAAADEAAAEVATVAAGDAKLFGMSLMCVSSLLEPPGCRMEAEDEACEVR